jgi:hypothetical protein
MERNQLIALSILIFSLSLIMLKRLAIMSNWRREKCKLLKKNKLSETDFEIVYIYVIKGIKYQGRTVEHFDNPEKEREMLIHRLNPHLSIPNIPVSSSDNMLVLLSLLAGLYLYLYQCECLPNEVNQMLGIPEIKN